MTPAEYRAAVRRGECVADVSDLFSFILNVCKNRDDEAMAKSTLIKLVARYGAEDVLFAFQVVKDDYKDAGLL